ncbi:hypothetical protein B0T26DRAFT_653832 [Lasiosphaeria miniovina]|uniref:Phosphotransferase n=1 Tax=Lasiosphaeria miniovina TaxID=1954250 RepID=A0AA40DQJ5_9PEZI|nr:uncharacterized protein B0T26DRAFT_653832 [Lasiosphaeria miniovina]KAK0709597.1 hypothetical protein B0T26DRAFT_653832 [Lasiosphaeria miniovina]
MTSLRDALVAALKSLLRGKSFLQALLAFWVGPAGALTPQDAEPPKGASTGGYAADFLAEAEVLLLGPIANGRLEAFAAKLKAQFREGLRSNPACMLPSYNHQLPSGTERGRYLALDVGGSTLRVALVELKGRETASKSETVIIRIDCFRIDNDVRSLRGAAFFDWMAERIQQTVAQDGGQSYSLMNPLLMGLAWSFPIEQTSSKGGILSGMGKGFLAAEGLLGQDLGEIIKNACQKRGLHVELSAIVNDSSAALLSEAYSSPSTRFGLILGTGVNIAAHLPVTTIGQPKYGDRPDSWYEKASHVVVNTELGMFGTDILPLTRWDILLKKGHPRPDFQPLEHLVSGYYLGEVCRLALVEAVESTGLFSSVVPPSLSTPYSLDTETLSLIEGDSSSSLEVARLIFTTRHPLPENVPPPSTADMAALRTLSSYISKRSASIVAASLFALWELKAETETDFLRDTTAGSPFAADTETEMSLNNVVAAFNGSVIERYPGYRHTLQQYINQLVASSSLVSGSVELVEAKESSLLGAAVALASLE